MTFVKLGGFSNGICKLVSRYDKWLLATHQFANGIKARVDPEKFLQGSLSEFFWDWLCRRGVVLHSQTNMGVSHLNSRARKGKCHKSICFGFMKGKPTQSHPPKQQHSLRKQFWNNLYKLSPHLAFKLSRQQTERRVCVNCCANSFYLSCFLGGLPSLDRPAAY